MKYIEWFLKQYVRHCGLEESVCAWKGTGCVFESWYSSQTLRLLGPLRGFLGTFGLIQKLYEQHMKINILSLNVMARFTVLCSLFTVLCSFNRQPVDFYKYIVPNRFEGSKILRVCNSERRKQIRCVYKGSKKIVAFRKLHYPLYAWTQRGAWQLMERSEIIFHFRELNSFFSLYPASSVDQQEQIPWKE